MLRLFTYGASNRLSKTALALIFCTSAVAAEPVEVVALGDSLTAGYGLPQGQGLVPKLQAWLDEQGVDAKVVNAGVSGDTTRGGLSRVEWSLSDQSDAMIVALGGNDLLRGIDPTSSRDNLAAILDIAAARDLPVLLVGLEAPSNYGAGFKEAFDSMYADLSQEYDTLFLPDFFEGLRVKGGTNLQDVREFMQPDGIHPNAEGVERIVSVLGPRVEELVERTQ
ncbi:acyl-CoA thioesterase-1 [Thalassococcus halodurans]|uniref:Acyl-CoA thioesterase-1 n=1 Tax=Thalassococcus halodurans TaxID=373675 RepID=A0A1H5ZYD8_9RHOB|nr:arylesterase [Thalassococcus halodurans]SEG40994.1 acyl-CoA thioesterase-1 [Thalassococcus halodurans]